MDGETLADHIARGPIPVEEALPIARQIAEALEAAHEQGIVHRDLKPANIKVRRDGTVKVLDFGLAKALAAEGTGATADVRNSPTITSPAMTQMGMILGTAAYMAPEQARGKPADKRSDIWAFGCVFYEMLTGRRAFEGEEVTETVANVIRVEPAWQALPAGLSPAVAALLKRCLTKDPKQRMRDGGDVGLVLDGAFDVQQPVESSWGARWIRPSTIGLAVLLSTAAAGVFVSRFRQPTDGEPIRFSTPSRKARCFETPTGVSSQSRRTVGSSPTTRRAGYTCAPWIKRPDGAFRGRRRALLSRCSHRTAVRSHTSRAVS